MTSVTSSSKWIIYKSALKRIKWLGILYGVALFLQVPLLVWMELSKQKALQGDLWTEVANKNYLPQLMFNPIEHLTNIAVPIVFGLILFHYIQQEKASTFFHSLPIKRGFLYVQNLLAGLTLIWLPILINGILIYGVFSLFGVKEGQWMNPVTYSAGPGMVVSGTVPSTVPIWQVLFYWMFLSLLMTGLFYIFTVFIGMFTGNVLLQGVLTIIGLLLPLALYVLAKFNLWKLLYGYPRNFDDRSIEWLSPLAAYLTDPNFQLMFKQWTWYLAYFAAAIVFCMLSIYLYRKRNAEAAGETLAAGWIRQLFKYGVAACAALTGGLYFSTFNENSTGVLYLGYGIGAVIGYVVADMVAYKSFHFYRRWKGMLVFGAVFILLLATVKLDVYGYQRFVPEQDRVKEVFISNLNGQGLMAEGGLTGADNIRRVRQLHEQIIKNEKADRALQQSLSKVATRSVVSPGEQINRVIPMELTYVLNSGSKVRRNYTIDIYRYRQFLSPIFNTEEAKRSMYGRLFKMGYGKIDQINVSNHHLGRSIRIYKPEEVNEAIEALKKDVLKVSYETAVEGRSPVKAMLEFAPKTGFEKEVSYNLSYYNEFKNFEAFLERHKYIEELFLNPEDVSAVIVKRVETDETAEVKDKSDIEELLDWCSIVDEGAFRMEKLRRPPGKSLGVQYFGEVVTKKGKSLQVMFDGSPQAQQRITEIINS